MSTQPHFPAAARQTGGADISAHNRRWHCISSNQSQAGPCVGPPMLHMEVEDPPPPVPKACRSISPTAPCQPSAPLQSLLFFRPSAFKPVVMQHNYENVFSPPKL